MIWTVTLPQETTCRCNHFDLFVIHVIFSSFHVVQQEHEEDEPPSNFDDLHREIISAETRTKVILIQPTRINNFLAHSAAIRRVFCKAKISLADSMLMDDPSWQTTLNERATTKLIIQWALCTIRSHGTKLYILVSKLRSGTSKTKAGPGELVQGALFWKSHCATCSPVYIILYHVTGSCKGPILKRRGLWRDPVYLQRKEALGCYIEDVREVMPVCVVEDARKRWPNPEGVPYCGHRRS